MPSRAPLIHRASPVQRTPQVSGRGYLADPDVFGGVLVCRANGPKPWRESVMTSCSLDRGPSDSAMHRARHLDTSLQGGDDLQVVICSNINQRRR